MRVALLATAALLFLRVQPIRAVTPTSTGLYIIDRFNHRIVWVRGISGAGWTSLGSTGHFAFPVGIALDGADRIYVADYGNHRLVKVDAFAFPGAIAIDPRGGILIADSGNCRIVRIADFSGAGWRTLRGPGEAPAGSTAPAL